MKTEYNNREQRIYSEYAPKSDQQLLAIIQNKKNYIQEVIEIVIDILEERGSLPENIVKQKRVIEEEDRINLHTHFHKILDVMKIIFTYYFDKWWRPILFCGLSIVILGLIFFLEIRSFRQIGLALLVIGLLGLLFSAVFQLMNKRWVKGILSLFLFVGTSILMIFIYFFLYIMIHPPDIYW
jgi:hypothetical protein